jgi:enediyne biosynthesis protein E3
MNTHAELLKMRLSRLLTELPKPPLSDINPLIRDRLSAARTAFLEGFRKALNVEPPALRRLLEDEPFQRRGFALEGAAMALVLFDEFSPTPRRLLDALLIDRAVAEQTLVAIGVGWASARLGRPLDWLPAEFPPRHLHAVVDGYGFHQGVFHSHRFTGRGFRGGKGELSTPYDIGLGRALWFVHTGAVEPIVHSIDRMPVKRRQQLWRGVGTACAFTGNTASIAAQTGRAAGTFESHFWTGFSTGAQLLCTLARSGEEETA